MLAVTLAAVGYTGMAHAQISDWEYLNITIDLVEQERRPHDVGSDLIMLTLHVTNNGDGIVHRDGAFVSLRILEGEDVLRYGNTYWSSGPMAESCPKDIRNINARLTKTWNACFEIPQEMDPDFLTIIYSDSDVGHIVQFDAYQSPSCLDTFYDVLCAPYALDGGVAILDRCHFDEQTEYWVCPEPADDHTDANEGNGGEPTLGGFDALGGSFGIDVAEIAGRTYAVVTSFIDGGVQIMDITNPREPTPVSSVFDDTGGFDALGGSTGIAIAEISGRTYVVVGGALDSGVQIIDITNPREPVPASSIFDGTDGFDALDKPLLLAVTEELGRTYVVVGGAPDGDTQIIDITNPREPVPALNVFDRTDILLVSSVAPVTEIAGRTYVIETYTHDNGVQIRDITDPDERISVANVFDGMDGFDALGRSLGIDVAEISGRTYAVVAGYGDDGVQIMDITDPRNPVPASSVFDGMPCVQPSCTQSRESVPTSNVVDVDGFDALHGAHAIAVAEISGRTYAVVAGWHEDGGVQIMDVTNPREPVPVSSVFDGEEGFDALGKPVYVDIANMSGRTYALVASSDDDGIQIMDITNPREPAPTSSVFDNTEWFDAEDGFDALSGSTGIAVVEISGRTYALVAGMHDDGVQIMDITNPREPAPISSVFDDTDGFDALGGAVDVAVMDSGGRVYALVAGMHDDGVQIMDITNPREPVPISSVFDDTDGFDALNIPADVAVMVVDGRTYAAVTGWGDNGVQIMDVTNPREPAPVSSVFYEPDGFDALGGLEDITIIDVRSRTFALVASWDAEGVQIIDLTNPREPAATSSVFDGEGGFDALSGSSSIAVAKVSGRTYALVASWEDDGVQIIDVTNPGAPAPVSSVFASTGANIPSWNEPAYTGGIITIYAGTDDPVYQGLRVWLQDNEDTVIGADSVTGYLTLLEHIPVNFEACGTANAWYSNTGAITMCYELADEYTSLFRESEINTGYGVANALHWVFMHELGHAVIDMYGLPIVGQEEDAADQFATVMLLREGRDGARALQAMAHVYDSGGGYTPSWDTHSLDSQRYYNMMCLLYGKHHDDDIGQSVEYRIPDSRAVRCPAEYTDAVRAWEALLADYIRGP